MSDEPTREQITEALHLETLISEREAQVIRDTMNHIGAELATIADAIRPFMQAVAVTVDDINSLHKLLFQNTDGEPRSMNTNKRYPTSQPAWARKRK